MKSVAGNIVDIIGRRIFPGKVYFENSVITEIKPERNKTYEKFILPGFIDSHVHVESSMVPPSEFARNAVRFGTVATVSDPHEIANVLGLEGILFMLKNSAQVPFKFFFGAPSCVPATDFETSGAKITAKEIDYLLSRDDILYLSEMMNFPGVIQSFPEVIEKIEIAKKYGKPIDGHAPGLIGEALTKYIESGITTDHETFTFAEGKEKIEKGMKILIREGSSARNFDELFPLLHQYPKMVMFCSDDIHPNDFITGHINQLVKRAIENGADIFDVLRAASLNPVLHYRLPVGLLRVGDDADFIIVDSLKDLNVLEVYIGGQLVASGGVSLIEPVLVEKPNMFNCESISSTALQVASKGKRIRVIEAIDGELITNSFVEEAKNSDGIVVSQPEKDILKIVVMNRYSRSHPQIGFIKNFGLKNSAIVSTVAHDSHNIVCVGLDDDLIARAINLVIANKGGLAYVDSHNEIVLPLPIAGIMSDLPLEDVARLYAVLEDSAKRDGSPLRSPFMTLSFMSLLVIPHLKIGDRGLFDVDKFQFVGLFAD